MKLITRYIAVEFIKPLVFSVLSFGGLVMISEFFRELNTYLANKASFLHVFEYLLYNFPWWTIQVLPIAVLLAVLFSLGGLARHNEITAMKSAGVNIWKIFSILFVCGMFITAGEIFLREEVVPKCVKRAEAVWQGKIKHENRVLQTEFRDQVVMLPGNGRMTMNHLSARTNKITGVVIDYYNGNFELKRQLVSKEAAWNGSSWELLDGVERMFSGATWMEAAFQAKKIDLPFKPEDYIEVGVRPEQMTTPEFADYIEQLDKLGKPIEKELIQFHSRYASAFSHLIVIFIGIPFALGLGSKYGKIVSFTFAVIFAFIYWGFQALGQSLGQNGVISPALAAWMGNIVFGLAGLVFVSKVQK